MKVIVFVKATPNSEQGIMPGEQLLTDMGKFNEALVAAGIMQSGDGLKPSAAGKRVRFLDGRISVTDGPFAETKELVAGFWVWNVKSMDEALEWARRCPNPMPGEEGVLEIRPVYEFEDFGEAVTEEHRERDARLRRDLERQQEAGARKKKGARPPARRKPAAGKVRKTAVKSRRPPAARRKK